MDFKEIKYLSEAGNFWVDRSYIEYASSSDTTGITRKVGPNGSPFDNSGKFTQKQRYNEYKAWKDADAAAQVGALKISYDSR